MSVADIARIRREVARWYILEILHTAQPAGLSEPMLLEGVQLAMPDLTGSALNKFVDYLLELDLVKAEGDRVRHFDLTAKGYQVAEGTVDVPPGIRRPG